MIWIMINETTYENKINIMTLVQTDYTDWPTDLLKIWIYCRKPYREPTKIWISPIVNPVITDWLIGMNNDLNNTDRLTQLEALNS